MTLLKSWLPSVLIIGTPLTWLGLDPSSCLGFESTKVLPKGVRGFTIKNLFTETSQETDKSGHKIPLSQDLHQELTFQRILNGETDPVKKALLAGFLKSEQNTFQNDDSLGQFSADLNARIQVIAPIATFGLTEHLTLAAALPIYDASTDVKVGFRPDNDKAMQFLNRLSSLDFGQPESATEAAYKLNHAEQELQDKLVENGFQPLGHWHQQAMGDLTLAAKYLGYEGDTIKIASVSGVVLATGRVDDPDILTDIAFGDGQNDIFAGLILDEALGAGIVLNQHLKYTYQARGHRQMRLATLDEKIQVEKDELSFKLGDKIAGGLSIQWQSLSGFQLGTGASGERKWADHFDAPQEVRSELERKSAKESLYGDAVIGYSTVEAYKAGTFAVPASTTLVYRKQLASRLSAVTDFVEWNVNIYF